MNIVKASLLILGLIICVEATAQDAPPQRGNPGQLPTYFPGDVQFFDPSPEGRARTSRQPLEVAGEARTRGRIETQIRVLNDSVKLLNLGGFHKEAAELQAKAAGLEAELKPKASGDSTEQLLIEIRELRRTIEELRNEVRALRVHQQGEPETSFFHGNSISEPESRLRQPGSRRRISDEELDAGPVPRPGPGSKPQRRSPPIVTGERNDEPEFELVPVPSPEGVESDDSESSYEMKIEVEPSHKIPTRKPAVTPARSNELIR